MKACYIALLMFVLLANSVSAEIFIGFGADAGKVGFINQNSNPGEENPGPIGPLSFRLINDEIWVADTVGNKLLVFSDSGELKREIRYAEAKVRFLLEDFAPVFDDSGKVQSLWLINGYAAKLVKISSDGKLLDEISSDELIQPMRIEVDAAMNLVVADDAAQKILIFAKDKTLMGQLGYEWSGFAITAEPRVIFCLKFNSQEQKTYLVKKNYAGKVLGEVALGLGNHFNPYLWAIDNETSEALLAFKPAAPVAGQINLSICSVDGSVKNTSAVSLPVAMTRYISLADFNSVWLAQADYNLAPAGKLILRTVNLSE